MRKESKTSEVLMNKLMSSILEFLMTSGLKGDEVREMFTECLGKIERRSGLERISAQESRFVGNGNVSAEVIRIWHRDVRFLDREARPKPLRLSSGPRSLGALIKQLDPKADHMQSIRAMRAVGLIRRLPDGRYLPTAESVTIDHLHPLAIEHVAKSLVRLVSTVCRNTDPSRKAMPLIERYAYVPDLSRAEASAFAEFTRAQGMAYLEAVDDWLERRRARRMPKVRQHQEGQGIAAGVHLFAYLGDRDAPRSAAAPWRVDSTVERATTTSTPLEFRRPSNSSRAARA